MFRRRNTDPEFKKRDVASKKRWQQNNPEYYSEYMKKYKWYKRHPVRWKRIQKRYMEKLLQKNPNYYKDKYRQEKEQNPNYLAECNASAKRYYWNLKKNDPAKFKRLQKRRAKYNRARYLRLKGGT